ncbi:MAG: ABC transporter ATP-binding protein [Christensenellales bacterium]|jgi:ABC-2 type transport system ATP-binding protein
MIRISNLSKCYGTSTVKAVDDISFEAGGGEIVGFLGPNGAGKSTTIKCITGILPYNEGHINVCGIDLADDPVAVKQKIGYVPDEHVIYEGLTGLEYINFICDIFNVPGNERKERIEHYAEMFNMQDKLGLQISKYSHGMKQKVSVISALVHEPEVFILDEPMTGLDPQSSYMLKQVMNDYAARGKVVFFSSHVLEVVEKVCSRILIIDKGKLITDFSINELKEKRSETSLEDIFLTITKGGE